MNRRERCNLARAVHRRERLRRDGCVIRWDKIWWDKIWWDKICGTWVIARIIPGGCGNAIGNRPICHARHDAA